MSSPAEKLAAEVRAAMVPLQDAHENGPAALGQRQVAVYRDLYIITGKYIPASGRKER